MNNSGFADIVLNVLNTNPNLPRNQELYSFCQPFFDAFGINYFDYSRFYPDNTCHVFCSDLDYLRFFLDYDNYPGNSRYKLPLNILTPGKHLWQSYICPTFLQHANQDFNHVLGITIICPTPRFIELYNFSAPPAECKVLDLYLNHDYLLETFVNCFRDHFSHSLNKKDNRIIVHPAAISPPDPESYENALFAKLEQALSGITKIRKNTTLMPLNGLVVQLSKQEINCLTLLTKGKSAKEIARLLEISPKTVEIHCGNLLRKTQCTNRIEMFNKLNKNFLDQIASVKMP